MGFQSLSIQKKLYVPYANKDLDRFPLTPVPSNFFPPPSCQLGQILGEKTVNHVPGWCVETQASNFLFTWEPGITTSLACSVPCLFRWGQEQSAVMRKAPPGWPFRPCERQASSFVWTFLLTFLTAPLQTKSNHTKQSWWARGRKSRGEDVSQCESDDVKRTL